MREIAHRDLHAAMRLPNERWRVKARPLRPYFPSASFSSIALNAERLPGSGVSMPVAK